MHVRCSYCNRHFNLVREYLEQAVAEAEEKGQKYHAVECVHCRKLIKIPVAQMRRFIPPEEAEEQEEA